MKRKGLEISNSLLLLIIRLSLLYVIMGVCRVLFYVYNFKLMSSITLDALPSIIKGSFIFDSVSIFYVNILFVFLSLIPFYFRESNLWQKFLGVIFTLTNTVAILINLADVFYFPYKLARIAGDDLRYLKEDNIGTLTLSFLGQYWWGLLLLIILMVLLYRVGFVLIRPKKSVRVIQNKPFFYLSQSLVALVAVLFSVIAIRGYDLSAATFPITVSDATMYTKPNYAQLILSNPFCLIRTAGHTLREPELTTKELFKPVNQVDTCQYNIKGMNIMIFVLEGFGSAHIKSISDGFAADDPSFTPFLDSLFQHGTLITNTYQSGGRSIDAMPSIWASMPSYKQNFLSLPQSIGTYHALPAILEEMGYTTAFMHGATSSSMSFKAFGEMVGVQNFIFKEEYEQENGTADFDGKWGIWDHKFLPFTIQKMNELPEPFFSTTFTLSSHNPYSLPEGYQNKYPKSSEEIEETIAYSDDALRLFFEMAKKTKWYNNTLFIITADHGSGANNDKWRGVPYNYRIPLFFYTPSGMIASERIEKIASQVDIMPTILSMMGYDKRFFAYGDNIFNNKRGFAAQDNMGTYNIVTDSLLYQFDDTKLIGVYDYRTDLKLKENRIDQEEYDVELYKSYIQSYYETIKKRKYTVE